MIMQIHWLKKENCQKTLLRIRKPFFLEIKVDLDVKEAPQYNAQKKWLIDELIVFYSFFYKIWNYLLGYWVFQLKIIYRTKTCTFDPTLLKPKCVLEAVDFLKNCKQTAEQHCIQFVKLNKLTFHMKHLDSFF